MKREEFIKAITAHGFEKTLKLENSTYYRKMEFGIGGEMEIKQFQLYEIGYEYHFVKLNEFGLIQTVDQQCAEYAESWFENREHDTFILWKEQDGTPDKYTRLILIDER
jgi:hypothetical protein